MICERCKDANNLNTTEYNILKEDGTRRKAVLCDDCAAITRTVHKLTGGKETEAKPSAPKTEAVDESQVDTTQSHTPQGGGSHSGHPRGDVTEGGGVKTNPARKGR